MSRRQDSGIATALEELGLSPAEATTYAALLRLGNLGARDLAEATGVKRSSIYAVLRTLEQRGLVQSGAGYGSRFRAVPPERALPSLVDHERTETAEALARKEVVAKELAQSLSELHPTAATSGEAELVEVIRNPRAVAERFSRLQLGANESIEMFVKAPIVHSGGNPEEDVALDRGVRVRSLYEQAILDDQAIRPHLQRWVEAGEEARVYHGELPFKLALFDAKTALMPLETPETHRDVTSILIRNAGLGRGLAMLFDRLWAEAAPIGEADE